MAPQRCILAFVWLLLASSHVPTRTMLSSPGGKLRLRSRHFGQQPAHTERSPRRRLSGPSTLASLRRWPIWTAWAQRPLTLPGRRGASRRLRDRGDHQDRSWGDHQDRSWDDDQDQPSPIQINHMITNAKSAEEILRIAEEHKSRMNEVNWVSVLYRTARTEPNIFRRHPKDFRLRYLLNSHLLKRVYRLNMQGMANLYWSYARLGFAPNSVLHTRLTKRLMELLKHLNTTTTAATASTSGLLASSRPSSDKDPSLENQSQHVSNILWAFARLRLPVNDRLGKRLQLLCERLMVSFSSQSLSNSMWAFARLQSHVDKSLWEAIFFKITELESPEPQHVSNILWSLGTLSKRPPDNVTQALMSRLSSYTSASARKESDIRLQTLSNSIWALGKLSRLPPDQDGGKHSGKNATVCVAEDSRESLEKLLVTMIPGATRVQEVSNVLWGMAKLKWMPRPLLVEQVDTFILEHKSELNPLSVSNLLWSEATLGTGLRSETQAILLEEVERCATSLSPQMIGNCLWAITSLDSKIVTEKLIETLGSRLVFVLDRLDSKEFASVMVAYGRLSLAPPVEQAFLEDTGKRHLQQGETQEVCNIAWGFARMNRNGVLVPTKGMVEDLCVAVQSRISNGTLHRRALGSLLWTFATLQSEESSNIVGMLEDHIPECARKFNAKEVTISIWAFAKLSLPMKSGTLQALEENLVSSKPTYLNPREVSTVLWGYARSRQAPAPAIQLVLEKNFANGMREHVFSSSFGGYQALLNTAWALRKMRLSPSEAMKETMTWAASSLIPVLSIPKACALVMSLASLATTWPIEHSMNLLEVEISKEAILDQRISPEEVANFLYACARSNYRPRPDTWDTLIRSLKQSAEALAPSHIAQILWADTQLGRSLTSEVLRIMESELSNSLRTASTSQLAVIASSLATSGIRQTNIEKELERQAHNLKGEFLAKPTEAQKFVEAMCALNPKTVIGNEILTPENLRVLDPVSSVHSNMLLLEE